MKPHQVEKDYQTVDITIWWPCSSPDISCCNSENWSQGNRNEPALKLQINWTWNSHSDADQTTSDQSQDDCQHWLLFWHITLSLSVYKISCPFVLRGEGSKPLDRCPPSPSPQTGIQNKVNVPFYQPGLFIGFWGQRSQTRLAFYGQPWNYHGTCHSKRWVNFSVIMKV